MSRLIPSLRIWNKAKLFNTSGIRKIRLCEMILMISLPFENANDLIKEDFQIEILMINNCRWMFSLSKQVR